MATYYARKSGNINAADMWATTPTGIASNLFPTFTNADVLMANNNINIIINVDTTVGTIRGDTFGGATNGGQFILNSGRTLTANVTGGTNYCVLLQSGTATIVGNVSNSGAICNGAGTLNIVGNVSGTTQVGARTDASTATISISGNVTGGAQMGVLCQLGTVNINGNITGGTTSSIYGVHNATNGTVNVTNGIVTGGNAAAAFGIQNQTNGIVNINGIATGGNGLSAASGVNNASTGNVFLKRAVGNGFGPGSTGVAGAVGLTNSGAGFASVEEIEFGAFGMSPVGGGGIRLKKASTNVAVFNYADTAGAKTLIDATANAAMPAATDVRSGVSYASGALIGACAVPAAGSTALGVPVDAGYGTAVLTPEAVWGAATRTLTAGAGISASDVWDYATRSLTTSSGPTAAQIRQEMDSNSTKLANLDAAVSSRLAPSGTLATVTTLTNAPTVPTPSQIASQVRSELSVELNRVDQAISTRATPANIPAADITAIRAKTDALVTDRLAQCSTVATTGAQLAAALS